MFGQQFHRNCADNELRREIAACRRQEQMQQKTINWLSPGDETQLETTIGYEHLAVDLTAWLAQHLSLIHIYRHAGEERLLFARHAYYIEF